MKLMQSIIPIVLLIILISLPAGAEVTKISPGDRVYLGEGDLDISDALGDYETIAFYYANEDPDIDPPEKLLDVPNPESAYMDPEILYARYGKWYQWDGNKRGDLVFIVSDPSLRVDIYDTTTQKDVTNEDVPRGHYINFEVITNLGSVSERSGYTPEDAPINLIITDPEGNEITDTVIGKDDQQIPLHNLPVTPVLNDDRLWYWVGNKGDHEVPSSDDGWNTGARDASGTYVYKTGKYTIWVVSELNGMNKNYLTISDGSPRLGKTISAEKTITLYDGDSDELSSGSSSKTDNESQLRGKESTRSQNYGRGTGTM